MARVGFYLAEVEGGSESRRKKKNEWKVEMVMVGASRLSCCRPNHARLWRRDAFGPMQLSMVDLEVWPVGEEERRSQSRSRFTVNPAKLGLIGVFLQESDTKVPSMHQHLRGCRARYPGVWVPPAISNICNMSREAKTNLEEGEGECIFNVSSAHFEICKFSF